MERKVFPAAILNETVEVYDARISVRSQAIYLIILVGLLSAFSVLPIIHVDVAVQSRGTFQSALQRNSVMSSVGGRLEIWNISENKKVKKGDVLAVIRAELVQLEMNGLEERKVLLEDFIFDLEKLLKLNLEGQTVQLIPMKSKYYQAILLEFQTKIHNQAALLQKSERDFDRAKLLFHSKSIAFADYDNIEVQFKQVLLQMELLKKQQINLWEQDLTNHQNEKLRIKSLLDVHSEQIDQYKIFAGTNGTLINVLNLNEGDFIHPQQKLAEISPDTTLLAVTYISPLDIAFIETGQEVVFQVDAYNYNQWGIARGKVVDIAEDITLLNEREAGFLVTSIMDKPFLTLSSGQEGHVKKGMTFNARFIVARRSLFQLLYDKVDNWLNPQVQPQT